MHGLRQLTKAEASQSGELGPPPLSFERSGSLQSLGLAVLARLTRNALTTTFLVGSLVFPGAWVPSVSAMSCLEVFRALEQPKSAKFAWAVQSL